MRRKYSAEELTGQAYLLDKINGESFETANRELIEKILIQNKNEIVDYIRTASREQGTISINHQKDAILNFCKKFNVTCKNIFIDDGFSGLNFNRPGIKKITEHEEYKVILVKDFSRFSRDYIDTKKYIDNKKKILLSVTDFNIWR